MIDERIEEQAAMHVLGALNEAEAREFKQELHANPELQAYVARLSTATGALAGEVPSVEPPPQLRAKILAKIAPKQKMVYLPERKRGWLSWIPWLVGAGFAVACLFLNVQDRQLRKTVADQADQILNLNQQADRLTTATNSLQKAVLALQETNRLVSLRIALLNSQITDAPKAVAVSLWDNQKQDGVFLAQNLKILPADRDYQLWVLDNGTTPVSAGVFHVNADGSARADFKTQQPIQVAGKFAVTEEPKGGLPAPTLRNLVLSGD